MPMKGATGKDMTNEEVLKWIRTYSDKKHLNEILFHVRKYAEALNTNDCASTLQMVLHGLLDAYHYMPSDREYDVIKTALRHLIKMYMSGPVITQEELSMYDGFVKVALDMEIHIAGIADKQ